LDRHIFNESEMARSSECTDQYARKVLDTADIVREAIYRQPFRRSPGVRNITLLRPFPVTRNAA
jgi:hypothetical protein